MIAHDYAQASAILQEGAASATFPDMGSDMLQWLDAQADPHAWLSGGLLGTLFDYVIQALTPMKLVLDELAGDPGAVLAHSRALNSAADDAQGRADALIAANGLIPPGVWTGSGSDAARAAITELAACHRGHADCSRRQSAGNIALAGNIAMTRQTVVQIVREFVVQVVDFVVGWLWALPWSLGHITGTIARMVDWVLNRIDGLLRSLLETGSQLIGTIQHLGTTMHRAAAVITTGKDPGQMHLPSPGAASDDGGGAARPEDREYIDINQHVYDPNAELPEGVTEITDPDQLSELGLTPEMLDDPANGLHANVYETEDGRIIVGFEGTDFGSQADLIEIGTGGVGVSPQTRSAIEIAQALERSGRGGDVVYTGHSLGGRLATIASMTTGQPAVNFNPAGVSPATVDYIAASNGESSDQLMDRMNEQNRYYYSQQDPLQLLQEDTPITEQVMPDAVGTGHDIDTGDDPYSVDAHGLDSLEEHWGQVG